MIYIPLEGTSLDINIANLRESLAKIEGAASIHALHIWSLTSGVNALNVHAVLGDREKYDGVLTRIHEHCLDNFKISHITVQIEPKDFAEHETHL